MNKELIKQLSTQQLRELEDTGLIELTDARNVARVSNRTQFTRKPEYSEEEFNEVLSILNKIRGTIRSRATTSKLQLKLSSHSKKSLTLIASMTYRLKYDEENDKLTIYF